MNYLQKKKLAFMSIANRIKGFVQTVTGALPLTLTNCVDNKSIINYKLYGQCVQDGIPTPNNPIEVQSVGDFSKNLFDINSIEKMYSTGGVNLSRYLSITDVTLVLVLVLALLVVTGTHPNEKVFDLFKTVMTMVITYFFTKKSNKENGTDK